MSLAFLFRYLILNMFRMLVHPSSGVCDLFVELFRYFMINMFRMLVHPSSGACDIFVELFSFISLFNSQHVSDVSTSILRSLRHIC